MNTLLGYAHKDTVPYSGPNQTGFYMGEGNTLLGMQTGGLPRKPAGMAQTGLRQELQKKEDWGKEQKYLTDVAKQYKQGEFWDWASEKGQALSPWAELDAVIGGGAEFLKRAGMKEIDRPDVVYGGDRIRQIGEDYEAARKDPLKHGVMTGLGDYAGSYLGEVVEPWMKDVGAPWLEGKMGDLFGAGQDAGLPSLPAGGWGSSFGMTEAPTLSSDPFAMQQFDPFSRGRSTSGFGFNMP